MWFSSLFSRVRADRSSASRKQRGTRSNWRREGFRPQIETLEDRLAPALMIVGSLTDGAVDLTDATVTLRDAIYAANNDLQVSPGGPTGSGSDEIQFGVTGTIPLSQGELAITSSLKITGPGAGNLTVSGGGLSRIFNVDDSVAGPTIDVEIVGLRLTSGTTLGSGGAIASFENLTVTSAVITGNSAVIEGGGIYHDGSGTLTVTGSTFTANSAGNTGSSGGGHEDTGGGGGAIASASSGTVTVTNSILSDNFNGEFGDGGGIWNLVGTVSVTNSILSGNTGEFGGGIYNYNSATATVTDSTLSGNTASDTGGGIATGNNSSLTITNSTLSGNSVVNAGGGGIFSFPGATVTVINSTLSGNSAGLVGDGGGIANDGGTLAVTNSTLSGNSATGDGGGIWNVAHGTATLTNSTLSGNSAGDDGGGIFNSFNSTAILNNTIVANSVAGGQIFNVVGGILAGSNNLIEGETPVGLAGTITADPKLGPLQNNGGPTQTHKLLLGSPAIDKGSNALAGGLTTDQRGPGFARILDGDNNGSAIVDIGAFEFHSPQQQVADLDELIDDLVAGGSLNQGQGNALTKKKENALKKFEKGQVNAAINELNAFVNQVQAFIKTGNLTASEGAALLAGVHELLVTIAP